MSRKIFPLFLVFFVMGFGDAVGPLVGFVTKEYGLTRGLAGLLPFSGYIAYGLFSIPISLVADARGKKWVLVVFLGVAIIGEIIALLGVSNYGYVIGAIFLIGVGITGVQVAGNPAMRLVSKPGRYSRNLNFAQFIKGIGGNTGPFLLPLIVYLGFRWHVLFGIYAVIMMMTLISLISFNLDEGEDEQGVKTANFRSSIALLRNRAVFPMVTGIFLSVAAGAGLNSWIATYLEVQFGLDIAGKATLGLGMFTLSGTLGLLVGTLILHYLRATRFFLLCSLIGVGGVFGFLSGNMVLVLISIVFLGFATGNLFPVIFSLLVDAMPERDNELSGLMVMAIVGAAIGPGIMGVLGDHSIRLAFVFPLVIFVYLTFLAVKTVRDPEATETNS